MVPPVDPVALHIGPLSIHWYGILIVTGVLLGTVYAARQAPRKGIASDHIWNGLVVCVILGIIGARLYHVFSSPQGGGLGWSWYREHPEDIVKIWYGGLGIYGAIIGGVLGVVVYARYHKLPILTLLDLGGPGLALGQAIGRWGNFINQELYGPPTSSSWWGVRIDADHRLAMYPISQYPEETLFHPTFLYESLWTLALFITLAVLARKLEDRLLPGDIFAGYVMGYGLGRFWIEFFRPDAWMVGPLAAAQWVGLILLVAGAAFVVLRHRRARGDPSISTMIDS
ncbi:MAG TPA: prolipoprotein diacylglyceryl transferase [Anaerolineales bacterium]|nr:prolipoprotein diacylglyceryl transferase [Anaerolineae bacterium]HIQ01794.1 prolipoprotein diacylglyceryl transferase [Anaerolineales bacterium]